MKYAKWISALMILIIPALATAQLQGNDRITAQIPFKFVVANTVVPAGELSIQRLNPAVSGLLVKSRDARIELFAAASPALSKSAAGSYALLFHCYGDRCFLAGVMVKGSRTMYTLHPSKLEAEMRAQNAPAREEILLASAK